MEQVLSAEQVAKIMGIGVHAARKIIRSKGFPAIPIGKRYIVPADAFYKWFYDPKAIDDFNLSIKNCQRAGR